MSDRDESVTFLCHGGPCEVIRTPARVVDLRHQEHLRLVEAYHTEHGEYPNMEWQIDAMAQADAFAHRIYAEEEDVTRRRIMMRQSLSAATPTPPEAP